MGHEEQQVVDQVLITEQERVVLVIASHLLSYPPESREELIQTIEGFTEEALEKGALKDDVQKACSRLFALPSKMLRELYVNTFDLKSKVGLYLTGHEFGDSPKRGAAIIKLQRTIEQAGYERVDDELADFIPMLLEFLVVAPEPSEHMRLYKRLAIALRRIEKNLDDVNPYSGIIRVLNRHVFQEPTEQEMADVENNREEADLEDLPFPLMYQ